MAPKVDKITISFTKDEVDWLGWVMTEVLGKATHVPPHDDVAKKITNAVSLLKEINATLAEALEKEFADDDAGRTDSGRIVRK